MQDELIAREEGIRHSNLSEETRINRQAVKTDMFKNKKEQILDFIRQRKRVRTSDVIRFGLSIYTTRGDRYARDLAEEGRIKRLSDWNKRMLFGKTREDIWEFIK